jgi:hypothetical protein
VILADTSVWVDHLRQRDEQLVDLLDHRQIVVHPFVIGELALGNLKPRSQILGDLAALPQTTLAAEAEVLHFIERHGLFGTGIGYIDAHLLTAAVLTPGTLIWTRDRQLSGVAAKLRLTA